jgi:rfaE bifunctional protein nucleotidyltransferase chain/domain
MRKPQDKILSFEESLLLREKFSKSGKKIVVTNGCFDILHRGHVCYLANAGALGDSLWLLVNSDASVRKLKGPGRPLNNEFDRAYVAASLEAVDFVLIFNSVRCTSVVEKLRPDIYVKGGDYNIDTINGEEKEALLRAGADICFIPFVEGFSTTDIIKKMDTAAE